MPKGPSTTQYIGGIVANQLSKMGTTIIGSTDTLARTLVNEKLLTRTKCQNQL